MVRVIVNCREKWDGKAVMIEINGRHPEHVVKVVEKNGMYMFCLLSEGSMSAVKR